MAHRHCNSVQIEFSGEGPVIKGVWAPRKSKNRSVLN